MKTFALLLTLFAAVATCNAATVTYNPHFTTEGSPTDFAVEIVFDDNVDGLPHAIQAIVTLTPGVYVGDIVALYVDLTSALKPLPAPYQTIVDAIVGDDITGRKIDTKDVQGGNIGREYALGLAIGKPGIGKGKGDIRSTTFTFNTPGLELEHLAAVGVRVTSVGFEGGSRSYSRKMAAEGGDVFEFDTRFGAAETPEPSTWALILSGLGAALLVRRRAGRA